MFVALEVKELISFSITSFSITVASMEAVLVVVPSHKTLNSGAKNLAANSKASTSAAATPPPLKCVLYIYHPIRFKNNQAKV